MSESLPRPVNKRVLVKPLPPPEKSEGGLFIPGNAKEIMEEALVIKSASDVVKDGEIAIYPAHLGVELQYKGVKHKWLNDSEIWGVDDEKQVALSLAGQ